jgi:predicted NBD/HSP70 family sugar kinase
MAKAKKKKSRGENGLPAIAGHGAKSLPSVEIDHYNIEIKDEDGFLGDRASGRAFRETVDGLRKTARLVDGDPFGKTETSEVSKSDFDRVFAEGHPEASAVMVRAMDAYAEDFAHVVTRFLKTEDWRGTERIVVGGGMSDCRVGETAVCLAEIAMREQGDPIDIRVIRHHPDEAGLIGAAHLAPAWVFKGHDAILAIDVGGSNIRCGVVELNLKKARDLSKACVWKMEHWKHSEDEPTRKEAVDRMIRMLKTLIRRAHKHKKSLAPFIGLGCPGFIDPDGTIDRGGQNLPGDWEQEAFNLPDILREAIPEIEGHATTVVAHNDAVVQGLSQTPFMQDVKRWGVLTIGTGLGNARFTNRGS